MAQHSMTTTAAHEEETLAESENVSVHQCSCGKVHLQIGAVCLTMEAIELAEVGTVILRALERRRDLRPGAPSMIN